MVMLLDDPDTQRKLSRIGTWNSPVAEHSGEIVDLAHFSPEVMASWTGQLRGDAPRRQMLAAGTPGPAPTPQMQVAPYYATIPYLTPPTSFLDLVDTIVVDLPSTPYAQEVPYTGTGPEPVAWGAVKPQMTSQYVDQTANTETIAAFQRVNRQTVMDRPAVQTTMQNRMMVALRRALEHEILVGTGTVSDVSGQPGIVGLLSTTGVAAVNPAAGVVANPDVILQAITTVEIAGAVPNVVVMNPTDRETLLITKASGSGEYVADPFLQTQSSIWDLPIVRAVSMPQGKILVGDMSIGITLLAREGANMRISDADSDNFTRNQLTLLAEGRWGLMVNIPAAFSVITLS
jgi:HK97 family phage major capsid protein